MARLRTIYLSDLQRKNMRSTASTWTAASSATSRTGPSASGRRQRSPIKSSHDLERLARPVRFSEYSELRRDLPHDLRDLNRRLLGLCRNRGVLPSSLREQLLEKDESLDDEFYFAEVTVRNTEADPSLDDPSRELESLESIMQSASHCYRYSASEAAWNQKPEPIPTAQPLDQLLPANVTSGLTVGSKMVDYALLMLPGPNCVLRDAISRQLDREPQTINQPMYEILREHPIALSIEMKQDPGADETCHQLSVWTSAWHARTRTLMLEHATDDEGLAPRVISLPLLYAHGHVWRLFFAVDRGDAIDMIEFPDGLVATNVLQEYKLLATL
ncbi:hypothetical protein NKR23_g5715 [Pleurostoma richardsiae]|uniref:PD-(D/E)XK nuclease-like domain-containing protein n=1 Tax=Pleurostoma richardsiae TaxID=41990 RepID=A0AA38RS78_9PEZI|nr:hypothetical protein NKR23_g5715 [Pleurostoma richardsiae]